MDSKGFTQTSFCDTMIDNITSNSDKDYILTQLSVMCKKRYSDRYAKVYNDRFIKNLNNPHLIFLKSSGSPYLMFITNINDTHYCFLIDKKIKEGYNYPKIFIIPITFNDDVYNNTLLECELIRDKNNKWVISICDSYYMKGKTTKEINIIDRINDINEMFENDIIDKSFMAKCRFEIKRYFDYKEIGYINKEFMPLLTYNIRGYYFIPMNTKYSKILYLIDKMNGEKRNYVEKDTIKNRTLIRSKEDNIFRIIKTTKPDVYDLLKKHGDDYKREGILLVQTIIESHKLAQKFKLKNSSDEIFIECDYDSYFKKWKFKKFVNY